MKEILISYAIVTKHTEKRVYFTRDNKSFSIAKDNITCIWSKGEKEISFFVKDEAFYNFMEYYDLDWRDDIFDEDKIHDPIDWDILDIEGKRLFGPWHAKHHSEYYKVGNIYQHKMHGSFAYSITEYRITAVDPRFGIFGVSIGGTCDDYSIDQLK